MIFHKRLSEEVRYEFNQGGSGKLPSISVLPDTEKRAKSLLLLVAPELGGEPKDGDVVAVGMVGKEKTQPMLFPPKGKDHADKRVLLLADFPRPDHRKLGRICEEKTTAKIVVQYAGGGAWGSGEVFLAILEDGQRVVSTHTGLPRTIFKNDGGRLVKLTMSNAELEALDEGFKAEML